MSIQRQNGDSVDASLPDSDVDSWGLPEMDWPVSTQTWLAALILMGAWGVA